MADKNQDKFHWLDQAREIAGRRGLGLENQGNRLLFPVGAVRRFRQDWENRDKYYQGIPISSWEMEARIYLYDRLISIPYGLIPFPFSGAYELREGWSDFIKGQLGFEYDSESECWGKRFDDPGEAVDEVERILSTWVPDLFESLGMAVAMTDAFVDEVKKRAS